MKDTRKILEQSIADHENAIFKAKADLEALDKPVLKHGMITNRRNYCIALHVLVDGKIRSFGSSGENVPQTCKGHSSYRVVAESVFDDLKALQEPLREFKVVALGCDCSGVKMKIVNDRISIATNSCYEYDDDKIQEISRNLRRLIFTAQKEKDKGK